ncbi:F0F1-type ATP synthase, gamma subunit [Candidatus Scalindua japonica]|uniref:ATP synthase gamma chain n=1 Tax=Candidatus Scalindua japonica TaxID=1284222 RepID=A0A286U1E4_9BACT|nr:ATP synthase F1 subunit gamma [Candidatus Scalindua japonica]GAX61968.1 F0F1-type ATP synthase, gamma subunit [Candidatus Scalindua japonica]
MESTRDIKNRIKSITNIKQITRAMEMVAANRLKKAEGRAISSRPYTQNITSILSNLTGSTPEKAHFCEPKDEVKRIMVLLITSDKGLCGAYNTNAIQYTLKFLKENSQKEISLYLMGKKGNIFFQNRPYTIDEYYTDTVEEIGLSSLKAGDHKVSEIVAKMINDFEGGSFDEIHLVYTKFKTVMKSDPARVRLLPLENIDADAAEAEGKRALQGDSILEPSSDAIFSKLLPKYLECQLRQAIFESLTAEYAARRMAMIAASENAEEIIGDLTQVYNKARQEAITKELLEVVSGSEAMAS